MTTFLRHALAAQSREGDETYKSANIICASSSPLRMAFSVCSIARKSRMAVLRPTHTAMLLGLHRPQHPTQFLGAADSEEGDINVRIRTWLACFIVDQKYVNAFHLVGMD
jgi:hypothetical protein